MNNNKQLDSYSLLIVSKYFIEKDDFINSICVCKKFKETTEKLRFNPIPITSTKLFPKIQTQYLYNKGDIMLKGIDNYEIWYKVNYDDYLKYKEDNIKCHHIVYSHVDRMNYGETIFKDINILGEKCFGSTGFYFNGDASSLETITIPSSITSLESGCFMNCSFLTSIYIPSTLTSLGDGYFCGCTLLKPIILLFLLTSLSNDCFYNYLSITFIDLPSSLLSLNKNCFWKCGYLKSIDISSVTSLGNYCFSECLSLEKLLYLHY